MRRFTPRIFAEVSPSALVAAAAAQNATQIIPSVSRQVYVPYRELSSGKNSSRWWHSREGREEFYKVLSGFAAIATAGSVAATAALTAYHHIEDVGIQQEERRAASGRELVKLIESQKTKLRRTIGESKGKSKHITQAMLSNEAESFDHILRIISSYDTTIIPELLKVEAEYQLQLLRAVQDTFDESNPDHQKFLRRCLNDIYETSNIASMIATANTVPERARSTTENLVYSAIHDDSVTTIYEIRLILAEQMIQEENETAKKYKAFLKAHPDFYSKERIRINVKFHHGKAWLAGHWVIPGELAGTVEVTSDTDEPSSANDTEKISVLGG